MHTKFDDLSGLWSFATLCPNIVYQIKLLLLVATAHYEQFTELVAIAYTEGEISGIMWSGVFCELEA